MTLGKSTQIDQYVASERSFRFNPLYFNQLRSFKAELFFKIEEDDFKSKGKWSETEVFFNISYAVLEMSCDKVRFID